MKVTGVMPGSQAEDAGIAVGDEIFSVNGGPARDEIDYMFYGAEDTVSLGIRRGEDVFTVELDGGEDHGIEFAPMELMTCGNRCLFCFIDQNPPGMRDTVFFKDEDYRLSFLRGAYVTLTTVDDDDIRRIIEQRLSPLYVSVHAVDPGVRRALLGIRRDDRLMDKIDRLVQAGIVMHAQIVVCPGINDGSVLESSIMELARRFPGVGSVAVVPVGLTSHRDGLFPLCAVDHIHAQKTIDLVDGLRKRCREELGGGFVYCSDEWFIRAGLSIPPVEYYDDFPQIENGVGMVRDFLDAVERMGRCRKKPRYNCDIALVTGRSMSSYIRDLAKKLGGMTGTKSRAVPVMNRFYGKSVTVSGLITGGDIIAALTGTGPGETVVLPPNCLNDDGLFLDGLDVDDVARALGTRVVQGTYDPTETFFR